MNSRFRWTGKTSRAVRASGGFALSALLLLSATGCVAVRPGEQRLVAKPNMTFSDAAALSYNASRLFPQMATGFAASGGTQNSGCTSCR